MNLPQKNAYFNGFYLGRNEFFFGHCGFFAA